MIRIGFTWMIFLAAGAATAGDAETREYAIHVDGKESGSTTMTIVQQDDGSSYMKAEVKVAVKKLIFSYKLQLDAEEWWKAGKLVAAKTHVLENARKTEVVARSTAQGLEVSVNGQVKLLAEDCWTSSFWKLADVKYHNKQIPIVETDTGKDFLGKLDFVGQEQLPIAGNPTKVYHFRVTGIPSTTDVWYDGYHRLVRMEFTEDGHKMLVHLTGIKR